MASKRPSESEVLSIPTPKLACEKLARDIAQRLDQAITDRGCASMVVSGGSSPTRVFNILSEMPLAWEMVTITLSDERWVPADDPQSNQGMLNRELLINHAAAASFVGLYRADMAADQAAPQINTELLKVPRPFDAVILGMGADGHTASLFPDSPDLEKALQSSAQCEAVAVPELSQLRMTLTPRALLDAELIVLLFFGIDKKAVYDRALGPGEIHQYPVRAILHQQKTPVSLYYAPTETDL